MKLAMESIWEAMRTIKCQGNQPVGVAMSPQTKQRLIDGMAMAKNENPPFFNSIFGIDYIIDPRLSDKSEVYYDLSAWRERCREQNAWDAEKYAV